MIQIPSFPEAEQDMQAFHEWVNAGGIRNNYRQHRIATSGQPVTQDDMALLRSQLRATENQIRLAEASLPK